MRIMRRSKVNIGRQSQGFVDVKRDVRFFADKLQTCNEQEMAFNVLWMRK